MTDTALDRWYAAGHLTLAHYQALSQWRDDGGGVRRRNRRQGTQEPRERPIPDLMVQSAKARHKAAWKALERLGDNVARAVHRLVMLDDEGQRVELVARGASAVWCYYRVGV